jgi:hypothetical protein
MDFIEGKGLRHFGVIDFAKKKLPNESHSELKSNILTCRGCDLLLGYHSFIKERKKHFLLMHALLNYKISTSEDDDTTTFDFIMLSCTGCSG